MSDFRFNFSAIGSGNKVLPVCSENLADTIVADATPVEKCREIASATTKHFDGGVQSEIELCGGVVKLKHIDLDAAEAEIKLHNTKLKSALDRHSDLVPNVYEGGLKIWECSVDLIEFLHQSSVEFDNKRVLELGCGVGLPGIYALMKGATVCFQDYNHEVIEHVTIPSVAMNYRGQDRELKYYAGEWSSLVNCVNPTKAESQKFDAILTSETIYNPGSYPSLIGVLKSLLKQTGVTYLAAKSHYFGVGGSTQLFTECIDNDNTMQWETVWTVAEGIRREVLRIVHK